MSGHKFNPENRKKLTGREREALLPPAQVLNDIGIGAKTTWADIGCGTGFFTIPLAAKVQQVFALDIRPEMLDDLRKSLVQQQISNVTVLQSEESRFPLSAQLVDGILISLVLHEVDHPIEFFGELNRILKSGGRVVVIEWIKAVMEIGPPIDHRLSVEQLDDWVVSTGLKKTNLWQWSDKFVGIEYRKDSK